MTGRDGYTNANSGNVTKRWITEKDFYAGVFPVTQAQYVKLMGTNPTQKEPLGDNYAVEHLSWILASGRPDSWDVQTDLIPDAGGTNFLARFNALVKTGAGISGFDLPTSPMWEIVARAGTETTFYWGDNVDTTKFLGSDVAADVGAHDANPWGFYSTIDKVMEWTRDGAANENVGNNPNRTDVFTPVNGNAGSAWKVLARIKGARFQRYSESLTTPNDSFVSHGNGSLIASQVIQMKGIYDVSWGTGFRVFWVAE